MKILKELLGLTIACFCALAFFPIIAFGASKTQDGIEVSFITNEDEYQTSDSIVATILVKNNNDYDVNNINIQGMIPEGYSIENNAASTAAIHSLAAGETTTLSLTFVPVSEVTTSVTTSTTTSLSSSNERNLQLI